MSEEPSTLEGISLESVWVLAELLDGLPRIEQRLLVRRYEERALAFGPTLAFVSALRILEGEGGTVWRGRSYARVHSAMRIGAKDFAASVLRLTLNSPTTYGKELKAVLAAFRLDEGAFGLRTTDLGAEQYAARNFLMEASAIRASRQLGYYVLDDWFLGDYLASRFLEGTPPEKLEQIRQRQADIGLAAEREVLRYERGSVGPEDLDLVVHVARHNTSAGFDIISVRRDEVTRGRRLRLIEVKAVSPVDWRFTLTRNEKAVAVENAASYFLYLVPVVNGNPDVGDLMVVADPVAVLNTDCGWQIAEVDWDVHRTRGHA